MSVYFDIETAPLDASELDAIKPTFEASSNLKDPEKIKADIARKERDWIESAALRAETGRLVCIGTLRRCAVTDALAFDCLQDEPEENNLTAFWGMYSMREFERAPFIGFNTRSFDLPFLIRRSWKLRVPIPDCVWSGRYLSARFIDLMEVWQCFQRSSERISLDGLCKFFGIGAKTGSGADFYKLWDADRKQALAYVENDLRLTELAARTMNVEQWFQDQKQNQKQAA